MKTLHYTVDRTTNLNKQFNTIFAEVLPILGYNFATATKTINTKLKRLEMRLIMKSCLKATTTIDNTKIVITKIN